MCEDEGVRVKLIRNEHQDSRDLPLEEDSAMRYTKLQHNYYMNNREKSTFCIVNSTKAFIPTELANLIYVKLEKNQVLRIKTIIQELSKPEKREWQIKLDEEQE